MDAETRPDAVETARAWRRGLRRAAASSTRATLRCAKISRCSKRPAWSRPACRSELGGGGADIDELADMLRILAHHCGSTALAFSMHTHQVAIPAWRWRIRRRPPVEPLLKRVAAERILLLSSGGSDWIGGSGKAEKVEGGYRITARKVFTSGAPTGDLLMTGAVLRERGRAAAWCSHFGVPMKSPQVKVLDTWRTLGMRGTGSHDVLIEGHVVPDAAVAVQRKAGEWHPVFQIIATIALPAHLCRSISAWPRARATSRSDSPSARSRRASMHRARRPHGYRAGRPRGLRIESMLAAVATQRAVGRERSTR